MEKNYTLSQAYQYCDMIAKQHYENFPTASLLLKQNLRPAVAVIYAFARTADDFADEGDIPKHERLRKLDAWEHQLELSLLAKSENPVFIALADVMEKFSLPVQLFRDLLTAFRMDVNFTGFESLEELSLYAKYSANPIGRLMLNLHQVDDEHALLYSDAICTALQLTNFWQDLKIDIPNGRCYLAREWLHEANISVKDILVGNIASKQAQPALQKAILETEHLFHVGFGLLPYLPLRLRMQIAATLAGGMAILKTTSMLEDPLHQRPVLGRFDWLKVSLKIGLLTLLPKYYANSQSKVRGHV